MNDTQTQDPRLAYFPTVMNHPRFKRQKVKLSLKMKLRAWFTLPASDAPNPFDRKEKRNADVVTDDGDIIDGRVIDRVEDGLAEGEMMRINGYHQVIEDGQVEMVSAEEVLTNYVESEPKSE